MLQHFKLMCSSACSNVSNITRSLFYIHVLGPSAFASPSNVWPRASALFSLTLLYFQLESSCVTIHQLMKSVSESQTRYRLREAQDRTKAEDLLQRVTFWSMGETVLLFVISVGQVMMLRSFFSDKKASVAAST